MSNSCTDFILKIHFLLPKMKNLQIITCINLEEAASYNLQGDKLPTCF